MDYLTID
jgi:hypothetical protein